MPNLNTLPLELQLHLLQLVAVRDRRACAWGCMQESPEGRTWVYDSSFPTCTLFSLADTSHTFYALYKTHQKRLLKMFLMKSLSFSVRFLRGSSVVEGNWQRGLALMFLMDLVSEGGYEKRPKWEDAKKILQSAARMDDTEFMIERIHVRKVFVGATKLEQLRLDDGRRTKRFFRLQTQYEFAIMDYCKDTDGYDEKIKKELSRLLAPLFPHGLGSPPPRYGPIPWFMYIHWSGFWGEMEKELEIMERSVGFNPSGKFPYDLVTGFLSTGLSLRFLLSGDEERVRICRCLAEMIIAKKAALRSQDDVQ